MAWKLLVTAFLASLFLSACWSAEPSDNVDGVGQDSVSVASVGKLQEMVGSWAEAGFFEKIEKTRSYTQSIDPKGLAVHEVGGKHFLSPFTVESDIEMELNTKPQKEGYAFDGQLGEGYYAKESYLRLDVKAERPTLVTTEMKEGQATETRYHLFESVEYSLLGGEYSTKDKKGKDLGKLNFNKSNVIEFENYVSYDLVSDSENDILLMSTISMESSFETFIDGAVWYLLEAGENGFDLYEIKNYKKADFDLTLGNSNNAKKRKVGKKGALKYSLIRE